jgi:hypothetical protein
MIIDTSIPSGCFATMRIKIIEQCPDGFPIGEENHIAVLKNFSLEGNYRKYTLEQPIVVGNTNLVIETINLHQHPKIRTEEGLTVFARSETGPVRLITVVTSFEIG